MRELIEYKGRTIAAETHKSGHGWRWSYQIDAGELHEGKDRPLSNEKLMLHEAIDEAKLRIDRM